MNWHFRSVGPGLLGLFALASLLSANLAFETKHLTHAAVSGEKAFTAEFPFVNAGDETVRILDVKSSCGCTVPKLDKQVYAPGESGFITAVFTYGSRSGKQHKDITVATDAGMEKLLLEVDIPVRWKIKNRILNWTDQNADQTQTIEVEFFEGLPVTLELIEINEERFASTTKWSDDGRTFSLSVTPIELEPEGLHRIEIHLRDAQGDLVRAPAYLRIR